MAVLAAQRRNRQPAELLGLHAELQPRQPTQQPRGIEQPIDEPGRVAEQREPFLQVDVDAAEQNAFLADVGLVGADGRVGGNEKHFGAELQHRGGQRVVVQAGSAVHASCAGAQIDDLRPARRRRRGRGSRLIVINDHGHELRAEARNQKIEACKLATNPWPLVPTLPV